MYKDQYGHQLKMQAADEVPEGRMYPKRNRGRRGKPAGDGSALPERTPRTKKHVDCCEGCRKVKGQMTTLRKILNFQGILTAWPGRDKEMFDLSDGRNSRPRMKEYKEYKEDVGYAPE
jgi:hypothetical protein